MSITKSFARVVLKLEGRPRQVAGEAKLIRTECDLVSDHSRPIYHVDADDDRPVHRLRRRPADEGSEPWVRPATVTP